VTWRHEADSRLTILLYCRPGFERDCAMEFVARARAGGLGAKPRFEERAGFVEIDLDGAQRPPSELLAVRGLVFARQAAQLVARVAPLPERDRATPIVNALAGSGLRVQRIVLETPDTNEGKTLSSFTRRFAPILEAALREAGILIDGGNARETLHVFFADRHTAQLAVSDPEYASPHPMGIARLRMPPQAASRSTLKLAEAFSVLVGEARLAARMTAGKQAVDLGAAPGGWSWQLAQRGLRVIAVDNGELAPQVLATGMVEHVRGDAFHFQPRRPVTWMVCDVVEQPIRIAGLAADWMARGWCREAIVNLKLPMKKRYDEWVRCREEIVLRLKRAKVSCAISAKQLYHDREEITVYLSNDDG
jgi:23S rRNA (cytidine2498-2'-O)-methyltransferase